MSTVPTVHWLSAEGIRFNFGVYRPNSTWPHGAGLYMFCSWDAARSLHIPEYIGQCDSFPSRLCAHERWDEAARKGATSVLLTSVPLQADRNRYEQILIKQLQPALNTQHKTTVLGNRLMPLMLAPKPRSF